MGNAEKKPLKKTLLFFILLLFVVLKPAETIYRQKESLFRGGYRENYEVFHKLYYSSQYVKKQNPSIIPDNTLESFAGGIFLRGLNPILIVHDQPPLGRYIIALSIFLFDNPTTIIVPLMFFSAFGIYLLGKLAINNVFTAAVPVALFINEPLFLSKFNYAPLLESIQLPFIIFGLYFFIKGIVEKNYLRWFILASLMLGFVISTRFFVLGTGLLGTMIIFLFLRKRFDKKFFYFFLTLPLSLLVLVLSYWRTLQFGYSIIDIFGIQKYILFYHKSKFILPFSFWDLLLFNRWHTWWGTMAISSDSQWIILWPISLLLVLLFLAYAVFKKVIINDTEKIIFLWAGVISIILSAGYTSTRYFLPVVPFLYILAVVFLARIFVKKS